MDTQLYVEMLFNNHKDNDTIMDYCKNIDAADEKGETTLHKATMERKNELVERLLYFGANYNIPANNGITPLILAAKMLGTAPVIFDKIIKYQYMDQRHINTSNKKRKPPENNLLFKATLLNDSAEVAIRLDNKDDPNSTTSEFKISPLHFAVLRQNTRIIKLILSNGGNINILDNNNYTPLMYAVLLGSEAISIMLLSYKAIPSIRNKMGKKAKDYCASTNSILAQKLNTAESFIWIILGHKNDPNCYLYKYNIGVDVFKCITRQVWKYITTI